MAEAPRLRILYANQLVIDQRWIWRLSDPFWRLYFNRDPGAAIADEHQHWELPPYRAVIVPAWGDFRGFCVAPVRHFYVHFAVADLDEAWIRSRWLAPMILDEDPLLRGMLDVLAHEIQPAYPTAPGADGRWRIPDRASAPSALRWSLQVEGATAWALARALERFGPQPETADATSGGDVVEPALRWIDEHLAEPLSVAALAHRCRLSPDHFSKRFVAATGRTPMRYVQERRITLAADRLLRGEVAIEAVARACGFTNRFHFSRVFTRLIGTPPAQYRRQHR